jgi:hypothetical protein
MPKDTHVFISLCAFHSSGECEAGVHILGVYSDPTKAFEVTTLHEQRNNHTSNFTTSVMPMTLDKVYDPHENIY